MYIYPLKIKNIVLYCIVLYSQTLKTFYSPGLTVDKLISQSLYKHLRSWLLVFDPENKHNL